MRLPKIEARSGNIKKQMVAFGGINYSEGARDGELRESTGLSSAEFPAISQRKGREKIKSCTAPNGIFAWGKLCVVDGTSLLYDGKTVGTVIDGPKEWAVVNTKLCIFPDKKYLDLESLEFGDLDTSLPSKTDTTVTFTENSITMETEEVAAHISPAYASYGDGWVVDGKPYTFWQENYIKRYDSAVWSDGTWTLTGEEEKGMKIIATGDILMLRRSDISGAYLLNAKTTFTERQGNVETVTIREDYSENDDRGFYAVVTGVTKKDRPELGYADYTDATITCEIHDATKKDCKLTARFAVGDRVEISGCVDLPDNNLTMPKETEKADTVAVVKTVDDYTITFSSEIFTAGEESAQVTIRRPVPDLKFICESDNRLWGCEGHTLWASALGDPKNFNVYDGLSTDSYAVAVGSDGEFTGCVAYSDSVLFWKEQCLHKVMGSYPAEYAVYTYNIDGVQAGSHKSLEIANEVLFYKGRSGVYAYTGGTPTLISGALGNRRYVDAAGGSDGRRYYISARETGSEAWDLFVYDIQNRIWLREDNSHVLEFANLGGDLYALCGAVWKLEQETDETVEWMAELVPFTEETLERKRLIRLLLRLELEAGATVQIEEKTDLRPWRRVWGTGNVRSRTFMVPLTPRRCDQYIIKLSGKGRCTIRSLVREYQTGSEKNAGVL